MLRLHYVTAVTVARNVARRGLFTNFCLRIQVLLRFHTVCQDIRDRRTTVCHGRVYVSSRPVTFCWDLLRFATFRSSSATSIKFCQGFLR